MDNKSLMWWYPVIWIGYIRISNIEMSNHINFYCHLSLILSLMYKICDRSKSDAYRKLRHSVDHIIWNSSVAGCTFLKISQPHGSNWFKNYPLSGWILVGYIAFVMHWSEHMWIILGIGSANERRLYNVTSSFIGWAHTQNDPWHIWYIWR